MNWPPQFTTRQSSRAKHLQIRISQRHGLEVVLPHRHRGLNVIEFLESKRDWISKNQKRLIQYELAQNTTLPAIIKLPSLEQRWQVFYEQSTKRFRYLIRNDNHLVINAAHDDFPRGQRILRAWLIQLAKANLLMKLKTCAEDIGLSYRDSEIRTQQSCWGSCSVERNIQLNCQLLFLPPALTRYVLIHELCHTIHMNHSKSFWGLVQRWDPNYKEHRALLRHGEDLVPSWYWLEST